MNKPAIAPLYAIALTYEQLEVIGAALAEGPYRVVEPVIRVIREQMDQCEADHTASFSTTKQD